MAIYPPQTLREQEIELILQYTKQIARALPVVGLVNIQYVIHNGDVYVIEVNPRASRTVPILSKVTDVPMVQLAIQVQHGQKLKDSAYGIDLYPSIQGVVVKAPVFSFAKMTRLDTFLGPEMKSTGEVLGVASEFKAAAAKSFSSAGYQLKNSGIVLCSIANRQKAESVPIVRKFFEAGYQIVATPDTAQVLSQAGIVVETIQREPSDIRKWIKSGKVSCVLNVPTQGQIENRIGFMLRRYSVEMGVPCFTSLDTAEAFVNVLDQFHTLQPQSLHSIHNKE